MKNELISIIVPVYNSEQYLVECINSILSQTYKNLEIILVNDGSTDLSGKIIDEYAKKDYRIRVFHQENCGAQAARSIGIANANGMYIGFVDSDDWIDANMYENLYRFIEDADLVTSGIEFYGKSKRMDLFDPGIYDSKSEHFCNNLIVSSKNCGGGMISGLLNNIYCKLYRTSIVKKCYSMVNVNIKNGEDLLFTLVYALNCNKIIITNYCHYHYRLNNFSVTHSKNTNYLAEINRFYEILIREITGHVWEKSLRNQLDRMFMYFIFTNTSQIMHMDNKMSYPQYRFPQSEILRYKKVILFGAGSVGQSYYKDWACYYDIKIVHWIDNASVANEIGGQEILKPKEILQVDYDYIVCAVLKWDQAAKMKEQLISLGIKKEKILWEKPIDIFGKFYLNIRTVEDG